MDLTTFNTVRVLVVGDLMVDEYVWGDVERISPEAPVQVVAVRSENYTLGGCGNVVNNIAALGGTVTVAGVIGIGRNGQLLLKMFADRGLDTAGLIQDPHRPTTMKTRIIAASQHVLRIDRETRAPVAPQSFTALMAFVEAQIPAVDVVVVSDYGKGVVTPELLAHITAVARRHAKPVVADPKGREYAKYAGVSVLTPNKKEAAQAAGIEISGPDTLAAAAAKILDTVTVDNLLVTCGPEGMVLFRRHQAPYAISARARQVYDVSGAGDTVVAVLALALGAGEPLESATALANAAAGVVVGKVGTATLTPSELAAAMHPDDDGPAGKHKSLAELPALVARLKQKGQRIVMTNGCFDLLHAGHVMLFAASKKLGDVLIVAIDDDEAVKALKGPGRPLISARQRVQILSALDAVDYVVVFGAGQLEPLIDLLRPDVLTKGSNYSAEEVLGRRRVEQLGGRVVLIPVTETVSATSIINHIKGSGSAP